MLLLYTQSNCGFSKKVIERASELSIPLTLKDIAEKENEEVLMSHGGKRQTPYLIDEERNHSLYGSSEIIAYLEATYASH